jgi:hypothetical protein
MCFEVCSGNSKKYISKVHEERGTLERKCGRKRINKHYRKESKKYEM